MIHDEPSTLAGDWHERPLLHFTANEQKFIDNGGWITALVIVGCWATIIAVGLALFFHLA